MTRASYAEACVEYAEACFDFRAWERSPRAVPTHAHVCDCEKCAPRRAWGDRAGEALRRTWDRVVALRPEPETEEDRHPSPRDESWIAKFNEEQR